jgi:transcriptional regulator with XRE-family HTH domain
MESLGERITRLRKKLDLSQKELADKTNLTEATLSRYENDLREPKGDTIIKIANALSVTTDYLLGNSDHNDFFITKIEKDIDNEEKDIEKVIDELLEQDGLMLCGEIVDEEDLMALRNSIRLTIDILNRKNKK